ncbi:MAG: TIGR03936 family radical SAM-associated protein [Sedimentisphaerales bacterium]
MQGDSSTGRVCALVKFRIGGSLRFLSHAETIRVFQRACVRAGVQIAYSQGFNPHQRMSLVPPRSVGVESDDDLLCLWLKEGQTDPVRKNRNTEISNKSQISNGAGIDAEALKSVLPAGIEIISAEASEAKNIPEPISARYVMKVQGQKIDDGIRKHISEILAGEKVIVNRRTGEDGWTKPVDVRPFLETIKAQAQEFTVDCKISPAGTIRVDEILGLLQLKTADLTGPVRRTNVKYTDRH